MKNEELIRRFRIERKKFDRSGIYAYTQRTLAYNSNKIEGSTLNEDQVRFVILTTEANPSVAPVHNRMPLILEPEELKDWVLDDGATEYLLHKTPVLLEAHAEYEQMRLF